MIWFNIKKLEELITENKVSDQLAFNYLLTHFIFITIAGYISGDDPLWMVWVHLIASLAVGIWGVRKTFEINKEGVNRNYFKSFICLSFVAAIRVVVLALCVSFVIVIVNIIADVTGYTFGLSTFQKNLLELSAQLFFLGIYFYILITSFKRINDGEDRVGGGEVLDVRQQMLDVRQEILDKRK